MSMVMNTYSFNSSLPSSSFSSSSAPSISQSKLPDSRIHPHCYHHSSHHLYTFPVSASFRRHRRRRRRSIPESPYQPMIPSQSPDQKLQMVIDTERLLTSSKTRFNQFVHSGYEALDDLRTLITFDEDRRLVVSCRPSALQFLGSLTLLICVIVLSLRALVKLVVRIGLGFGNSNEMVYRRDRSLGGREVVVGRKVDVPSAFRVLKNPLSPAGGNVVQDSDAGLKNHFAPRTEEMKLPSWWPVSLPPPVETVDKQVYQRMANRLIRAILDQRISGNDISEHDIVQFRRLCRACGVQVSIETTNALVSFYRVSVEFVLNICRSLENASTSVSIDGEDARQFVAGIAGNIGLENSRAARIVSAAVAARTRSYFLQSWALEMQGKHFEAVAELSKICQLHRIFPPEENSAEMEMVARGLEKHLKVEQRKFLMGMLLEICNDGNHRSTKEALGLVQFYEGGQQGSKLT